MKALFAKVTNVKAFPSTGSVRVEIEAPVEQFPAIVALLHEREVLVTVAPKMARAYGVVDGNSSPSSTPVEPPKESIGPLCQWAVMRCKDERFLEWLEIVFPPKEYDQHSARDLILNVCEISSRKELDTNPRASDLFDERFRIPFALWLREWSHE